MNVYDSHTAINIISDFVYDNFASYTYYIAFNNQFIPIRFINNMSAYLYGVFDTLSVHKYDKLTMQFITNENLQKCIILIDIVA